jgi:hypothetical protein
MFSPRGWCGATCSSLFSKVWRLRLCYSAQAAQLTAIVSHSVVCPQIYSTDLNGLTCKIVVETDLMREPPDHCAPNASPRAQHMGMGNKKGE